MRKVRSGDPACYPAGEMRLAPLVVSAALLFGGVAHAFPGSWPPLLLTAAGPGSAQLQRAQRLVDAGEFEAAVTQLQAILDEPDLTDALLVEVYRLLGLSRLYLGDEEGARAAYEKLLQAQPDFTLPASSPPKIQQLYARIRQDIRRRRVLPVTLRFEPLSDTRGDAAVVAQARIDALPLGARGKLFHRRMGGQSYSSVDFSRVRDQPEHFSATLPAYAIPSEERAYDVEYYVEVVDAAQRRLAGSGDAYSPLTFRVLGSRAAVADKPSEPAWYANPWVWAVGGAVATGAVVGTVLVATSRQTGQVTVTITVPGGP